MVRSVSRIAVTLVEMLTVLAILVILAGVAGVAFSRWDNYLKQQATKGLMLILDGALTEYWQVEGGFPAPSGSLTEAAARNQFLLQSLEAVAASRQVLERADKALFKDLWPKDKPDGLLEVYDPWQTVLDYTYVPPDSLPVIRSAGPDRVYQTGDDITSR